MIFALGAIGDERVLPILREELKNQSSTPYLEILYAMSLAGDDSALVSALRSTDATVLFEPGTTAVDYIAGAAGAKAVPVLIREIPRRSRDSRMAGLSALGTLGDASAVDFLLEWSKQPNPVDRRFALAALSRIGDPRAIPRIIEALSDPDPRVRAGAAEGAGYLRAEKAVPILRSWTKVEKRSVLKGEAVWSLGLIASDNATKALAELFEESRGIERRLVLQAVAKSPSPGAIDVFAVAMRAEDDPALERIAVNGLTRLGNDPGATTLLLEICASGRDHDSGMIAARALLERKDPRATPCVLSRLREEMDLRHGVGPLAEYILTEIPLIGSESTAASLEALAEEVPAPALEHKLRAAARGVRMIREYGDDAQPWIELLASGTPMDVDLAIRKLGDLGDPRAISPLKQLFGRIEPERAHAIPRALGEIGSERATPFLISLLTDTLYRVPSLARARDEAAIALAKITREPHAAEALLRAFELDGARNVIPLLAYAHIRGQAGIPQLLEKKALIFRIRSREQASRHERLIWAIRMLRAGQTIPIHEIRDPD
jgi:HEAT repeat protein